MKLPSFFSRLPKQSRVVRVKGRIREAQVLALRANRLLSELDGYKDEMSEDPYLKNLAERVRKGSALLSRAKNLSANKLIETDQLGTIRATLTEADDTLRRLEYRDNLQVA